MVRTNRHTDVGRIWLIAALVVAALLALPSAVSAHNRGLVWLPTGECVQIGSLKSVAPGPDKTTFLDLDPSTPWFVADEIGTSFAASQGNSAVEKGICP
jgi:hypothetical protein